MDHEFRRHANGHSSKRTFSMQYLPETNSTVHEQSAALNTNKQREATRNAKVQREAAQKANAQREATLNVTKQRDSELNADAKPYRPQRAPARSRMTRAWGKGVPTEYIEKRILGWKQHTPTPSEHRHRTDS